MTGECPRADVFHAVGHRHGTNCIRHEEHIICSDYDRFLRPQLIKPRRTIECAAFDADRGIRKCNCLQLLAAAECAQTDGGHAVRNGHCSQIFECNAVIPRTRIGSYRSDTVRNRDVAICHHAVEQNAVYNYKRAFFSFCLQPRRSDKRGLSEFRDRCGDMHLSER